MPTLPDVMTDPLTQARGLAITRDHEGFGPVTTTAPGIKLSRTPVTIGRPAAKPGSDAASVLAEIAFLTNRTVILTDLEPDTDYCYSIEEDGAVIATSITWPMIELTGPIWGATPSGSWSAVRRTSEDGARSSKGRNNSPG